MGRGGNGFEVICTAIRPSFLLKPKKIINSSSKWLPIVFARVRWMTLKRPDSLLCQQRTLYLPPLLPMTAKL